MKTFLLAASAISILAVGCSASTSLSTQKFSNDPVTRTATFAWTGQTIQVENVNGDVTLVPTAGLTTITLTAKPFAFAGNQQDANATIQEIIANVVITNNSGVIQISCPEGSTTNGTSSPGQSGCDGFTVNVPQGTAAAPVTIQAKADNGNLYMNAPSQGPLEVESDNGNVGAMATPIPGAVISVLAKNGDIILKLPTDFAADVVNISGTKVDTAAFPDVVSGSARGTVGSGAKSISVTTDFGTAHLETL